MRSVAILYSMYSLLWPSINHAFAMPTPQNRYPVGYNPDDRTRPVYFPSTELQHKPTWPPLRKTKWEPPEGYVPTKEFANRDHAHRDTCLEKAKWQPPTGYIPKQHKTKWHCNVPSADLAFFEKGTNSNLRGGSSLETVPWADEQTNDARIKLCTGIWMGKVILDKRCVYLD